MSARPFIVDRNWMRGWRWWMWVYRPDIGGLSVVLLGNWWYWSISVGWSRVGPIKWVQAAKDKAA